MNYIGKKENKDNQSSSNFTKEEEKEFLAHALRPALPIFVSDLDRIIVDANEDYQLGKLSCPIIAFCMFHGNNLMAFAIANVSPNAHVISDGQFHYVGPMRIPLPVAESVSNQINSLRPEFFEIEIGKERKKVLEPFAARIWELPRNWLAISRLREGLVRAHLMVSVDNENVCRELPFFSVTDLNSILAKKPTEIVK